MKKKFYSLFIFLLVSIFFIIGCNNKEGLDNKEVLNNKNNSKLKVVVSFNPLKEFTERIGGDKVTIETIIPEGTEPHEYEPSVKDLKSISNADIFIYNGLGMESWIDNTIKAVENKKLLKVNSSKGINPIKNKEKKEHGQYDPHIWLSLKGAKNASKNIKEDLIKKDPTNTKFYNENYNKFEKELDSLYEEYKVNFDKLNNKDFVTGHAAFAYFCRDFNLNQKSVEDVFAEGEPSAKTLKELVDYCKKNNIKTVFYEELKSPKVSKTLAKEVGAKTQKIYTIETKEDNKSYIEAMKYNLQKVYESLK